MATRIWASALAAACLLAAAATAAPLRLESISARPDMVSGGDVLVRLTGEGTATASVTLNGRDVSAALAPHGDGREGVVRGLHPGTNTLSARAGAASAVLKLTDWPIEGPIFSGPRQSPFICQTEAFKLPDGSPLGPSQAPTCAAPTRVQYVYKPRDGDALKPLPAPGQVPPDADSATTLGGARVPFVVRVETGVIDRSIYQFAVLADPEREADISPARPPAAWNRRLIALHGTGCPRGWYIQGAALGANILDLDRLAAGYALFASTLNHPTVSCNAVLAAEVTMMVKERVVETLGAPLYTLSMGASGGAYTSLQVADAYPGLVDGVLIGAVFPDALSIAETGLDGHLLTHYFAATAPGTFTPEQQQAVGGYGAPAGLAANANQAGRTDPVQGRGDIDKYASAVWNDAVPLALRYDPKTNRKGARPTVFDADVNIYGRDPATGFARRPYDNVGVQYGLAALNAGKISKAQFLDLNARIGGYDADDNYVPHRTTGDRLAIRHAYESGLMLSGAGGLQGLPVFDYGGLYTDLMPAGEYHMRFHHFEMRQRIADGGGAANVVTWGGGPTLTRDAPHPADRALRDVEQRESFRLMKAWMTARAADPHAPPPAGLTDGCWTREATPRFIAEPQVYQGHGQCDALYPAFAFPRKVAGGPLANNVLKCQLKPVDRRDYVARFTAQEWAQLKAAFPNGVCDWSRPGIGQTRVTVWSRY